MAILIPLDHHAIRLPCGWAALLARCDAMRRDAESRELFIPFFTELRVGTHARPRGKATEGETFQGRTSQVHGESPRNLESTILSCFYAFAMNERRFNKKAVEIDGKPKSRVYNQESTRSRMSLLELIQNCKGASFSRLSMPARARVRA